MKKLITLTAALLMTTQVFATENKSQESTFTSSNQNKCLRFTGKVDQTTSIKVTSNGLKLDNVDITVQSYSKGKDGIWTPIGDQEWDINLFYRGIELNVPFKVEIENVGTTSASQGPNLNFENFKDCTN